MLLRRGGGVFWIVIALDILQFRWGGVLTKSFQADSCVGRRVQGRDCQSRGKSRQGDQAARWSWPARVEGSFPQVGFLILQGICHVFWKSNQRNFWFGLQIWKSTKTWCDSMAWRTMMHVLHLGRCRLTPLIKQKSGWGVWSSRQRPTIPIQLYSNIQLTYMWCQIFGWTTMSHDLCP